MTDHTEAQAIEPAHGLVISAMQPGADIEANFEALKTRIDTIVADYRDVEVDLKYLPQARKDRAYLNSLSKELSEQRLVVKRAYMRPVEAFEMKVKELDSPIREAATALDEQIKALEEQEREQKRAELVQHWNAYVISDAIPFERIEDPKWMNRGTSVMAAKEAIDAKAEGVIRDIETLDSLELAFDIDAKTVYYDTFDVGRAIARNKELVDRKAAAEEIERQKAEFEAAQARAAEEAAQEESEPVCDLPCSVDPCDHTECVRDDEPTYPEQPETIGTSAVETPEEFVFTVTCTLGERMQIIGFLQSIGVKGVAKRGDAS